MKKMLATAAIVLALVLSAGSVMAAYDIQQQLRWSEDIYRFKGGCEDNDFSTDGHSCGRVTTFGHNGNRCYVAFQQSYRGGDTNPSISCVKE